MTNTLTSLEHHALRQSYTLSRQLPEETQSPVASRIAAVAIPIMCLAGETVKAVADGEKLLKMGYHTVTDCRVRSGNFQSGTVHFFEHVRNLTGICTGFFIGLYSPNLARQTFLVNEAKNLTIKLNPTDAARLYAVVYVVAKFFDQYDIDYRICSGTVLGAVRHHGIIPHDDDIDLMIHPDNREKCEQLFREGTFKKETGYCAGWQEFTGGWQCFHPESDKGEGFLQHIGLPFVDILYTEFDGNKIVYSNFNMRQMSTNDYYTIDEWGDPKTIKFGPVELKSIHYPVPYVKRCYGDDALDFASQTIHHEELAKIWENRNDVCGAIRKILEYGFPRRAYLANKKPIEYDHTLFSDEVKKVDEELKTVNSYV